MERSNKQRSKVNTTDSAVLKKTQWTGWRGEQPPYLRHQPQQIFDHVQVSVDRCGMKRSVTLFILTHHISSLRHKQLHDLQKAWKQRSACILRHNPNSPHRPGLALFGRPPVGFRASRSSRTLRGRVLRFFQAALQRHRVWGILQSGNGSG